MSSTTYNSVTFALNVGTLIAMAIAAIYLVAAIAGWRSPFQQRRLLCFAVALATFPALTAVQQAIRWGIYLPSLQREVERELEQFQTAATVVRVGDSAPAFTAKDTNGDEFVFDPLRRKVVLINFFGTTCAPCVQELPHFQKMWDENRQNENFAMIVIGHAETEESVAAFQTKNGYTFPMAADRLPSVYALYARMDIPRTYLVSHEGKICFTLAGYTEQGVAELRRELSRQLELIQ